MDDAELKQGWLFALDRDEAKALFAASREHNLAEFFAGLRERSGVDANSRALACGQDWAPLHRCLSDGTLDPAGGEPPLNQCILGGRQLSQDEGAIAVLVRPDVVPLVGEALATLTRDWLQARFAALDHGDSRPADDSGAVDQLWSRLGQLRAFYQQAAASSAAVVFAAGL